MKKGREKTRAKPVCPNTTEGIFAGTFQGLFGNKDFSLQVLEKFPFPIAVFFTDGTLVFINPAFREVYHIEDSARVVGKYNLLSDPLCFAQPEWIKKG